MFGDEFKEKTLLSTGAASGMGLLICEEFLRYGGNVIMADIDGEALRRQTDRLNGRYAGRVLGIECDVRDYAQVCRVRDEGAKAFGAIDILVNFAGGAETRVCGIVYTATDGNGGGNTNTSQIDDDAHYATDVLHKVNVRESDMPFVTDGETDYSIVSVSDSRAQQAATFIANHLYNATEARISVEDADSVSAGDLYSGKYIVLGDEDLFAAAGLTMPQEDLGYTGYYIKTLGDDVFIMEQSGFGFGYEHAARAFLSAVVGFEIYSTDMVLYTKSGATMPEMDIIEKPDFEIHRLGFTGSVNDAYAFGSDGGNQMFIAVGGEEWHNTLNYLPYETYGAEHPLWYESRARQLCVTAHGDAEELKTMQETVADMVISYLDANPDKLIITFTQEDNVYVCGCKECTALKQKYGTDAAAYIIFTNKIAELVDAHYAELGVERNSACADRKAGRHGYGAGNG